MVRIADEIVTNGPVERIRRTVKELMSSGAKGRGGLSLIVGDMLRGAPLEHRLVFYAEMQRRGVKHHKRVDDFLSVSGPPREDGFVGLRRSFARSRKLGCKQQDLAVED